MSFVERTFDRTENLRVLVLFVIVKRKLLHHLFLNSRDFFLLFFTRYFLISTMSSINLLNPKAEYMRKQQALAVQVTAATGMQEVLKTNLGKFLRSCYLTG